MQKKKQGIDKIVGFIYLSERSADWVCKNCLQKNMLLVGFNEFTSCCGCGQTVMIKRR